MKLLLVSLLYLTNYHFVASQNAGPIITSLGTITTNPWANFSY